MEDRVVERVRAKAETYGREPGDDEGAYKLDPQVVSDLYRQWVMPLTKDVQVMYLLRRLDE